MSGIKEAEAQAKPAAAPQTSIVEVSPEMAAFFLEKNTKNRVVRPKVVEAYARVMKIGGWKLTGEAIKFDTEGSLIDGQHRCAAIVQAGVPVTLTIVRGLHPETRAVMDSGVKRQAHDFFQMEGVKNSATVAAVARLELKLAGNKTVTNAELISYVDEHPEVTGAAEVAAALRNHIDINASVLGVAWIHLYELEPERCREFFESIAAHKTEGYGDPRNALIRRMTTARRQAERLSQEAQLSLVYRAWNAMMAGEQMFKLPIESRFGQVRVPEPVAFGAKPRASRLTRSHLVERKSEEEYEAYDWPTPDDDGQTEGSEAKSD